MPTQLYPPRPLKTPPFWIGVYGLSMQSHGLVGSLAGCPPFSTCVDGADPPWSDMHGQDALCKLAGPFASMTEGHA